MLSQGESATTILCSCKQTRFHIENPVYQELDIEGLNITVTSSGKSGVKSKGKSKAEGLEILSNASLKLKAGICYALIGRNGTGKSTLLKAIAEKLIPGIPVQTRISILQQTDADSKDTGDEGGNESEEKGGSKLSVLAEVIDRATSRSEIQHEVDVLSKAVDNQGDALTPVRAFRKVQHERLKKELFEKDKDARLRSGTRGMAARKALIAFEKIVADSEERINQEDEEIDEATIKEETDLAAELLAELQLQLEPTRLADIESKARIILSGLGFPKANLDKPVNTLSGGWKMRTNLASILLQPTDILILDEPTNFLDLLGIIWLQKYLETLKESTPTPPTIVIVSHDRDFITATSQELIILRSQALTYFRGSLSTYESTIREKTLYLTRMRDAQEKQKSHIQQTIQQNIKQGKATGDENKLRQAKSRQKKLDNRMGMEVSAKGTRFKLNRDLAGYHLTAREEIEIPPEERGISMMIPLAPDLRFPGPLLSLENISFRYPTSGSSKSNTPPAPFVLENVNLTIHMGDRIGIVGLNGAGKSTLLSLLTETAKPTKGTLTKHPRLRLAYYSQNSVEDLQVLSHSTPELTALSLLTSDIAGVLSEQEIRGILNGLGLQGRIVSDVPISKLSGGQLVRLALARLVWKEPQLLVLDEVTTHLDFWTVRAVGEVMRGWNGGVVVVSHDRWLVRKVVEGWKEGEEDEEDDDEDEEDEEQRRRLVYVVKGGGVKVLEGGVSEFERSLEKRVDKLMK
ncbi:putative abc transporter protein [Botrytis cinerea BcDW1]|uniref:Putative abc transporter protein n=1 Tax=Botryotinia fuckeliana (strain BcDW1) TaxID=1290391 RepID=M7V103_BOTF1|nr:putative abc transporter protein [Botrytis cinerea BcDW1]